MGSVQHSFRAKQVAYTLVAHCLPTEPQIRSAATARRDGRNPDQLVRVIDGVRKELFARIGEMEAGNDVPCDWDAGAEDVGACEFELAFQVLLATMPSCTRWGAAIAARRDGCDVAEVGHHVDELRLAWLAHVASAAEATGYSTRLR